MCQIFTYKLNIFVYYTLKKKVNNSEYTNDIDYVGANVNTDKSSLHVQCF